jgi:hypothetical protein
MPEPVLAGLGRGTATANWESGALTEGELILAIDGKTEVPLTEGRDGAYKLKQLVPGVSFVVRLYAKERDGRVLAAEAPIRVWTD